MFQIYHRRLDNCHEHLVYSNVKSLQSKTAFSRTHASESTEIRGKSGWLTRVVDTDRRYGGAQKPEAQRQDLSYCTCTSYLPHLFPTGMKARRTPRATAPKKKTRLRRRKARLERGVDLGLEFSSATANAIRRVHPRPNVTVNFLTSSSTSQCITSGY